MSAAGEPERAWALVVEDQAETRAWLVSAVKTAFPGEGVTAVETLTDAQAVLDDAPETRLRALRLALIDLGLPDGSGIDLISNLAERLPHVAPVVATVHDDDENLIEAISAGAQGYLVKSEEAAALATRLRRIGDGEPPLSPSIARRIMARFRDGAREARPAPDADLTPRELEVLALLAKGSRVAEAAQRLGLTEQTVATYVKLIYRKLRISSRAEAALAAARRGLV